MPEFGDALGNMLNDPDKLAQIMSIAQSFMGTSQENNSNEVENQGVNSYNNQINDFSALSLPQINNTPKMNYDLTSEILGKAMPIINRISQSNKSVSIDKTNLLTALAPFVSDEVSHEFSHAVKLISIAKMVKAVMGEFSGGQKL